MRSSSEVATWIFEEKVQNKANNWKFTQWLLDKNSTPTPQYAEVIHFTDTV